ncbi:hypothetical protein I3760_15G096400 [Carya illinoinensis]|nr:hypothetical protein I3760_15G096400 [Carya illinoinensis]
MTELRIFDLSSNHFNGSIDLSPLPSLKSLEYLDLSYNYFNPITLSSFFNLSKLEAIFSDGNKLVDETLSQRWNLGFQLKVFSCSSCLSTKSSQRITRFLHYQFDLQVINIPHYNFSGQFPTLLLENNTRLVFLSLQNNSVSYITALQYLYLDNNHFSGEISHSISNLTNLFAIDFSNNNLLGMLPRWMGNMTLLSGIALGKSRLEGPIPVELGNLKSLSFLDLSHNSLVGSIPSCFNWTNMKHVHLNKNRLTGPITSAFKSCSDLVTLNLRDNYFTGNIPDWIGNLSSLSILLLKANYLQGKIPFQICLLEKLRLLDLSNNNCFGQIPHCLSNITFEPTNAKSYIPNNVIFGIYYNLIFDILSRIFHSRVNMYFESDESSLMVVLQEVEFTTKNRILSYKGDILNYRSGIDLSCNKLKGEIPAELGDLSNIHALNLSFKNLTGSIPTQFSNPQQIESLDLSHNNLDDTISPQLIELNSLAVFNVAHNKFWGTTPKRKAQFGTFDESSYKENPLLCGPPLHKACTKIQTSSNIPIDDERDEACGFMDLEVFYASFAVSYTIMLLGIVSILYINLHW